MVKNTIQKMAGLQTRQYVYPYGLQVNNGTAAALITTSVGVSGDFTTNWGVVTLDSDEKVMLRSMAMKCYYTNNTNVPVFMWYWKVVPRKLTNLDLVQFLVDGHTGFNLAYVDPTSGTAFRRYFKIIKRGCRTIQAGQCTMLKHSRFWKSGKAVSGDVEGKQQFTPGVSCSYFCKFATIPCDDSAAGVATVTGELTINQIVWKQVTYTNIEDNDPSVAVSGSVTTLPAKIFTDAMEAVVDNAD